MVLDFTKDFVFEKEEGYPSSLAVVEVLHKGTHKHPKIPTITATIHQTCHYLLTVTVWRKFKYT
jgi:hypothetical protein